MLFINNKYTRIYYSIINNARSRDLPNSYTEKHHIIPKSLGGTRQKENMVKLTAREHFICHKLLTKMLSGAAKSKMIHALWSMMALPDIKQLRSTVISKNYETVRKQVSDMLSSRPSPLIGRLLSVEHKAKISKSRKERVTADETRTKMSASRVGRTKTEEWKANIAKSQSSEACQQLRKKNRELKKLQSIPNLIDMTSK